LSDLHFKLGENSFLDKVNNLTDSIKNKMFEIKTLFILISGDLAYSGKKEEYILVKEMLDMVERNLKLYNNELIIEFIFTPGNHDCDFSDDEVRDILIERVIKEPSKCSNQIVSSCTKVQENYLEFINRYSSAKMINSSLTNKLLTRYEYHLDKYTISFNSYNTAWMSRKNEIQSQLIFPHNLIEIDKILEDTSMVKISLFHHPYHWLEHQNIREFKNLLHESSDIIFTGHEHTPSASKTTDYYKNVNVLHIEAGTIQDSHDSKESKFNLLTMELDTGKKELFVYEWNKNDFENIVKKKLEQNTIATTKFNFKSEYEEKLNLLGIKTNHPRKDNVRLDDLFVYPHIKQLSLHSNISKNFPQIFSEKLLNDEIRLNIIYGEDNSGKTILSHTYQKS
jgi:cob(I)alamin adenosyltransferase